MSLMMLVVQRTQDDSWYDNEDVFVADESRRKQLVEVFGYFWHYLFNVSLNNFLDAWHHCKSTTNSLTH